MTSNRPEAATVVHRSLHFPNEPRCMFLIHESRPEGVSLSTSKLAWISVDKPDIPNNNPLRVYPRAPSSRQLPMRAPKQGGRRSVLPRPPPDRAHSQGASSRRKAGHPPGVSKTLSGKFQARIKLNGKRYDLGSTFETAEEAAAAYNAAKLSGSTDRASPKAHIQRGTGMRHAYIQV